MSLRSHGENFDLVLVTWAASDHIVPVLSGQETFGLLLSDSLMPSRRYHLCWLPGKYGQRNKEGSDGSWFPSVSCL